MHSLVLPFLELGGELYTSGVVLPLVPKKILKTFDGFFIRLLKIEI